MSRVYVVGAGQWGKNLVSTFYRLGSLAGVVEISAELRDKVSEQYSSVPLFSSVDEALAVGESSDAFVIATPAHTHFSLACKLLSSNRDVYVEKPLTLDVFQAEELVRLAKAHSRILMVGHLLVYQPAIQLLKQMIDAGELGDLMLLNQQRLKLGRVRLIENVLWSFGVHDLAVIRYLVGQDPVTVTASGTCQLQAGIEDEVHVDMAFSSPVRAHLHTSWLWPETVRRLTVVGTKASAVFDEPYRKLILHKKGIHGDLTSFDEGEEIVCESVEQPLDLECQHFLECLTTRRAPLTDGEDGASVVRILDMITQSLRR